MQSKLQQTLDELHEHLAIQQDLTDEQRSQLREISAEIQEILQGNPTELPSGLTERLNNATQHFETTHPVLTNTVGRIADLLSQLGI